MKKVFIKTILLSVILILVTSACTHHGGYTRTPPPAGPAGPSLIGNLEGVVFLFDDAGNKLLSSNLIAGDTIILTNNSGGAVTKTTTSTTGTYTFSNITTGTYSLSVIKSGYGTVNAYGYEFAGGGTAYKNFNLAQVPTTSVTTAQATVAGTNINISGTVPSSTQQTIIIIYISYPSIANVNSNPINYTTSYLTSAPASLTTSNFNYSVTAASLYDLGFASGNTVYFAAYIVGNSGSTYTDPPTGLPVYTAISSAPVITSVLVP